MCPARQPRFYVFPDLYSRNSWELAAETEGFGFRVELWNRGGRLDGDPFVVITDTTDRARPSIRLNDVEQAIWLELILTLPAGTYTMASDGQVVSLVHSDSFLRISRLGVDPLYLDSNRASNLSGLLRQFFQICGLGWEILPIDVIFEAFGYLCRCFPDLDFAQSKQLLLRAFSDRLGRSSVEDSIQRGINDSDPDPIIILTATDVSRLLSILPFDQ